MSTSSRKLNNYRQNCQKQMTKLAIYSKKSLLDWKKTVVQEVRYAKVYKVVAKMKNSHSRGKNELNN